MFEEANEPFSRDEADEGLTLLKEELKALFGEEQEIFEVVACGAYRRGEAELKDLDVLLVRKDGGSTLNGLMKLVEHLEERGIIIQQIKEVRVASAGSAGFQGLMRLPGEGRRCHRIDLHCYPIEQKPFAMLYFTGPPQFNSWLKKRAAEKGFSISDGGLQINRNLDVPP